VTLTPRKLLSAAAFATLAACAHTPHPAMRAPTPMPVPVVEASASGSASVPAAAPAPDPAFALPMCDANGRPLAGNVRTKNAQSMADCTVVTASR
jgi:hypothetical protein